MWNIVLHKNITQYHISARMFLSYKKCTCSIWCRAFLHDFTSLTFILRFVWWMNLIYWMLPFILKWIISILWDFFVIQYLYNSLSHVVTRFKASCFELVLRDDALSQSRWREIFSQFMGYFQSSIVRNLGSYWNFSLEIKKMTVRLDVLTRCHP